MKAVLDTNVLISGVITTGVTHDLLLRGFRGEYAIVVSVATLTEFRETLGKYPDHVDEADVQREVETVRYFDEFVDPQESMRVVEEDPDDDKFLEAAVAGDVDYVVSGDQHLLDLGSFRGIGIVDPLTFYDFSASTSPVLRARAVVRRSCPELDRGLRLTAHLGTG